MELLGSRLDLFNEIISCNMDYLNLGGSGGLPVLPQGL